MTVDQKEILVYIHDKADTKEVDFGDDGEDFKDSPITNLQISSNNKFFMIGIPEKRALGWFGLNRVQFTTRPLKWIHKYKFENFFADDHLSSLMLLDEKRKQLDYQFILWKFDTKKLDLSIL
jgi:hypothetical protein